LIVEVKSKDQNGYFTMTYDARFRFNFSLVKVYATLWNPGT
jgi:hypothetical protein